MTGTARISRIELEEQLLEADRQQGRKSVFYLGKMINGHDLMQINPHAEVSAFIEEVLHRKTNRFGIDLEPRGSFKTTQFSQDLPIELLLREPNLRILLDSAVLANSMDNLGVIKRTFEGNEYFRMLYGDWVGKHWTTEEITVSKRTRNVREPSIRCASVERVQVGPHYDVIIGDDLVSDENSKTPEGRKQIKDHFRLLFSLLEPGGALFIVGTRWHFDDLYGMILEDPQFAKRVRGARLPDGTLYFKERLTDKFLDDIKKRQGHDIFNCQYQNDPAPEDEHAMFQRAQFRRYEKLPETRSTWIAIDPGGEKKGSDEWAIITAHVDPKGYVYYDQLIRGHLRAGQAWDIVFNLVKQLKPRAVGLETTGGQKWLLEGLHDEMRRRKTHFSVISLPHAVDSKTERIRSLLQPRYQAGTIMHSTSMGPLEEQLLRFPRGKDDVADVAAMIIEIEQRPREPRGKEPDFKSLDEFFIHTHRKQSRQVRSHSILGDQW